MGIKLASRNLPLETWLNELANIQADVNLPQLLLVLHKKHEFFVFLLNIGVFEIHRFIYFCDIHGFSAFTKSRLAIEML